MVFVTFINTQIISSLNLQVSTHDFYSKKKIPCSKCQKAAGILTCRGCRKYFCYPHVAEHRQELNTKMNEVVTNHDQLQQIIVEQEAQPNCHPLMKKIDEWEQQSINRIHQAATNARKEFLTIVGTHRNKVTHDLSRITLELNRARDEDDYVETDLKEWIERIEKLNKDLTAQTIDFGQDNNSSTLISKIFINDVSTDFFDRTVGDIQVLENGQVAVHGQIYQNAAVRGRGEYSSGQYQLRFRIEQWNGNGEFSCGIVSQLTPMESLLHISTNYNTYDYNYNVFRNDNTFNNNRLVKIVTDRHHNTQKNDIIELFIDGQQHMIRLTNERTRHTQQLNVNITTCPFP